MPTRSILVSYAGYPFTPSSLMPDNGLANLAGALLSAGHRTLILDYGTVETVEKLYPRSISRKTLPIYRNIFFPNGKRKAAPLRDAIALGYYNRRLQSIQKSAIHSIAADIIRVISEFKPDFVGFKLWNGDGFSGSIAIAHAVKKAYPGLRLFAGGPHVDIFTHHIFSATGVFDALVYAEGEEVLPLLCEYCNGKATLSDIPNVIYREGTSVRMNPVKWIGDLDSLPLPVYDEAVYPAMGGNRKIKIIVLDESRGCPHRCAFCIQPVKSGSSLRMKSPARIVKEIRTLGRFPGTTAFRYAGSATPVGHAVRIAEKLIEEGVSVTYSSFGHIQRAREADFAILRKSGCYSIFFGIESGARDVLHRGFGKKIDPALIREVLTACRRAGIFTVGSVIFPGPFETEDTMRETIDLILKAAPDAVPVQFPGIYPGTEWRRHPEDYNMKITSDDYEAAVMNYKIKLLYPPRYWSPLPYEVNNMVFREFSRKTEEFVEALEKHGILTHLSDDQALMALHAGWQGKEREFRDRLRLMFAAGDAESIAGLVRDMNRSMMNGA